MNKQIKQKLCWNCEGSVATTIENCPYCGVYLSPEHQEEIDYRLPNEENVAIPKAPYVPEEKNEVLPVKGKKLDLNFLDSALPLVGLSLGVMFAIFSLALYFFEENGIFTLQWNAEYWYVYALIAVPSFCVGLYALQNMQDEKAIPDK